MADATIGALRIVLGADAAALEKTLKSAQSSLADFGANMAKAGVAAAAAFVAVGVGIAAAVKHSVDLADKLGKMSQKVGVPIEELSALRVAAELSDVSMESLGKSLGKLSKTMVEAAAKPTSDAANAFRALGISVKNSDGTLKSSSTVLTDVAGKFEGLKDGAGKTAVSMALFGRAGAELIPMLNEGKAGLEKAKEEAAKFGVVLSKETAAAAQEFNDNLKRLGYVQEGIANQIAAAMLPSLKNFSANLVLVAKNADLLKITGEALGGMLTGMLTAVARVSLAWNRLGVEWGALREFMQTDIFSGKVGENWKKFTDAGAESTRQLEALGVTMGTAHLADAFGDIGTKAAEAAPKLKEFNYQAMGGKSALDQFLDSQKKAQAAQTAQIAADGMATGAKERLKFALQALEIAQANNIVWTDALRAKMTEGANAAEILGLKIGNIRLIGESNPFAPIVANLNATNLKLQESGIKASDYAMLSEQAAKLTAKFWADSATSMGESFSSIGSSLASMNDGWARAAKIGQAIAAVVAFVNAYVAASEAFAKTPFPANIAISLGVLAKGIAMVAAIKSAVIPKAAMGGAFQVPGGVGGGDRVRAMIDVEPGEMIEVSSNRPGGYRSGSAGGSSRDIVLHGAGKLDDWLALQGRSLVRIVSEAIGDGARVRLA